MNDSLDNKELAEHLNTRFSALDANLRESFSSVKRDIISLRQEYSQNLKQVISQLNAVQNSYSKNDEERKNEILKIQKQIDALSANERAISALEKRLSELESKFRQAPSSSEISSIKEQLSAVASRSASKEQLKNEINKLSELLKRATSVEQVNQLKQRIEDLGSQLERIEAQEAAKAAELSRISKKIAISEKELSEHKKFFLPKSSFYEEVEYIDKELDSISSRVDQLEQLKKEFSSLGAVQRALSARVARLSEEKVSISQFEKSSAGLASQIRAVQESQKEYFKQIDSNLKESEKRLNNRIMQNEEEFSAVEDSIKRKVDSIRNYSVTKRDFERKIESISKTFSGRLTELSRKASSIDRRVASFEEKVYEHEEFANRISQLASRLEEIEKAHIADTQSISKKLESIQNSAASRNELSSKLAAINNRLSEISHSAEEGDEAVLLQLRSLKDSAVTKNMLSARTAELRSELINIKNKLAGISKDVERLEAIKTDEAIFRDEYAYIEKKILNIEKQLSDLDALKKSGATLNKAQEELKQKLAYAQRQFATKKDFNEVSSSVRKDQQIIHKELDEVLSSLSSTHDALESLRSETVNKRTFEMELAKLEQRLRRSSSNIRQVMNDLAEFKIAIQDEYPNKEILSKEVAALKRAISNVDRKASQTSLIPEILERIEHLERMLEEEKRRSSEKVGRQEFNSTFNSLRAKYYSLKRELESAIYEASKKETRSEVIEATEKHAPSMQVPFASKEEKPKSEDKKHRKNIFTIIGRIITDFFTVEETVQEKRPESEGHGVANKLLSRKHNPSKIIYILIALLIFFALAVILIFNFEAVERFFSSLGSSAFLQNAWNAISEAASSAWDFISAYLTYIVIGLLIVLAALAFSSEKVISLLKRFWSWLKGLFSRKKKGSNRRAKK
ncbi:MAG: hypothetical protein QW471_00600 [Candidatus Woesearchaeota archaeon]